MIDQWIGDTNSGAIFSEDRRHRFTLWRRWVDDCPVSDMCAFIGLNPSTADETANDPTIRRCIRFAKDWGYSGYIMLNLFSFRATDPKVMKAELTPTIYRNTSAIETVCYRAGFVVAAWGNHGDHLGMSGNIRLRLTGEKIEVHHLGLTKTGQPRHPLYVRADTIPELWIEGD